MYDYREYKPSKKLSRIIDCLWVMKKQNNMMVHEDIIIPNACAEIVITSGDGYKRIDPILGEIKHAKGIYILGQRNKFFLLKELQDGTIDIGVRFKPFSLIEIGIDVKKMSNQIVKFSELFSLDDSFLKQLSQEGKDPLQKLSLIEQLITKHIVVSNSDDYLIKKAIRIIHQAKGVIKVIELQEELFISKSVLYRIFIRFTGFSPKEFIDVWRFNYIVSEQINKNSNNLLSIALDFGFFDQAHFIKYFKKYTGVTPKYYFTSESYLSKIMTVEIDARNSYNQ